MASERQSRQQTSERAQTSSPNAQQGEWQPSTPRGGMGQQSSGSMTEYGQGSRQGSRGGYPTSRRDYDLTGYGASPFSLMHRLTDEMDRIFESFGMGRGLGSPWGSRSGLTGYGGPASWYGRQGMWTPSVDMCQRGDKLLVTVDLPGMKKEDVDVRVEENCIVIQGERHEETPTEDQGYHQRERSYGSFYRMIDLPEGANADQANATFRDGVLRVEVPVSQQHTRGRRLEIREGAGTSGGATSGTSTSYGGAGSTSTTGGSSTSGAGGTNPR